MPNKFQIFSSCQCEKVKRVLEVHICIWLLAGNFIFCAKSKASQTSNPNERPKWVTQTNHREAQGPFTGGASLGEDLNSIFGVISYCQIVLRSHNDNLPFAKENPRPRSIGSKKIWCTNEVWSLFTFLRTVRWFALIYSKENKLFSRRIDHECRPLPSYKISVNN